MNILFIAELGLNIYPYSRFHIERLVAAASEAGADAVKVQLWRTDHFPFMEQREKARYEFPRYEFDWFVRLARAYGLKPGASVFDDNAIRLCNTCEASFIKLAAREQANTALRYQAQSFGFGPTYRSVTWDMTSIPLRSEHYLATVSKYPTSPEELEYPLSFAGINLTGLWGWSSHTSGWADCERAVQLGAKLIEKHLCLDSEDPEAEWSLGPYDFKTMVDACTS